MTGLKSKKSVTCVFVHGWAMNSAAWSQCQALLPDWIDAIFVDLPGHGSMAEVDASSIDDYVQTLMPLVHRPVLWVGWSLGALAVMRLADLYPERVAAMLLVAATPCFVKREGWQAAVDEQTFTRFAQALEDNQAKTLTRFLSLQVKGLAQARTTVKQLQNAMAARGSATTLALKNGLNMLVENDYRDLLAAIECPVSWYLGGRDTLVPVAIADVIRQQYTHHEVMVDAQAGHIPFLSNPAAFIDALLKQASLLR